MKNRVIHKNLVFVVCKLLIFLLILVVICKGPVVKGDQAFFISGFTFYVVLIVDYGRWLLKEHPIEFYSGILGVFKSIIFTGICVLGMCDVITMDIITVNNSSEISYVITNGEGYNFLSKPYDLQTCFDWLIRITMVVSAIELIHPFLSEYKFSKAKVYKVSPDVNN